MLRDLSEFYDPDLYLPINGRRYRVAAVSQEEHERLRDLLLSPDLTADAEAAEIRALLGDSFAQMVADGVPAVMILHAGRTALMHFGGSPDLGSANWHMRQVGDLVGVARVAEAVAAVNPAPRPNRRNRRRRK